MPETHYRLLSAEVAAQLVTQRLTLDYADLFKIQRVRNPFPLRPVSVSRILAYLECPACALDPSHTRRGPEAPVFEPAERFQFKLLSTRNTFADHQDWGGYVSLVGEFDQIRLLTKADGSERYAIVKFHQDVGKQRQQDRSARKVHRNGRRADAALREAGESRQPEPAHALQLMIDWLAIQTRWDVLGQMPNNTGRIITFSMPLEQSLDLLLYDVPAGRHYQLVTTRMREALLAVVSCLFFVNWAMKSGYAWRSPEHTCRKPALLGEVPNPLLQVGSGLLSAEECYQLARDAFQRLGKMVSWRLLSAE